MKPKPTYARLLSKLRALLRCGGIAAKYKPMRVIGRGTYGTVFRVCGKKAIKWVRSSSGEALDREIRGLTIVDGHPNFVQFECVLQCQGEDLIVLELCDMDLGRYVNARQTLPEAQALTLMDGLLSALSFLEFWDHAHRDIKPANILMKGDSTLKVADLGTMRNLACEDDNEGRICCTIPFCAPEWLLGDTHYGCAVDVWSAGLVLHFMLTGKYFTASPGFSRTETLLRIFEALGTPTEATWPGVTALPRFNEEKWPQFARGALTLESDLLRGLIEPCPAKRWTAGHALVQLNARASPQA